MPIDEESRRRPEWVEGPWIVLGDDAWSFPPPGEVPGYREAVRRIVKQAAPGLAILEGGPSDPSTPDAVPESPGIAARLRTLEGALGLYRIVHRAGSLLLRANYELTEEECHELLPFDYSVADLSDPSSPLNTATPEELETCNRVASVLGIDVRDMARKAAYR